MTKANYNFEQGTGKKALLTGVRSPLLRHPLCHPLDLSTMSQASSGLMVHSHITSALRGRRVSHFLTTEREVAWIWYCPGGSKILKLKQTSYIYGP